MTWDGEQLAKHLAVNRPTQYLRDLCDRINDPNQRQLIMEGFFESLGVVDKLAFVGEFDGTPKTLAEARGDEPICAEEDEEDEEDA